MTVLALVVGLGLLAVALAQLILPRVAASRISSRIGRYGQVEHVSVSAWPALKLLWGDAGSADVSAGHLTLTPAQAAALLWEARGVGEMNLRAESVKVGPLQLESVTLRKRGAQLSAEGQTTAAQASAALPAGVTAQLLDSREGHVDVAAGGGLFGISTSIRARAEASEGRLVARPLGFLLGGFQLTVFSDSHVHVEALGASETGSEPPGYRLSMQALLR